MKKNLFNKIPIQILMNIHR